ncbi:uncharacterized protein LOC130612407 [Hydractinia symbiolongicarpus]|uniref:uncharacterized protein LOC130612407 n=1 Tax=Hydractinia symbiolongicarpus TaxID=13093 RepID=UPI00254D0C6F|nr:uncharacterized protein LOC130612407 [Hydractinia symbiolongicarpus]
MRAFLIVISLLCLSPIKGDPCCDKVSSNCDFLCDDSKSGGWWKEITCGPARVKLAACRLKNTDIVTLFGKDFTGIVQKGWNSMTNALKTSVSTVSGFKTAAVDELKRIKQDVLASLHTLRGMTKDQFKALIFRFKDFTTENLRHILNRVDIDVVFGNIKSLASTAWERSQLDVLAKIVHKKYGNDVRLWTSGKLKNLGNILAGLPDSDFAKFTAKVFDESLETLCDVKLSTQKRLNLFIPAESLFGKISWWNSSTITRMCTFVEELTPEQILSIKSKEIAAAFPKLKSRLFSKGQAKAILKKLKDVWGDVGTWSKARLIELGKFAKTLDIEDIKKINIEKIKEIIKKEGSDIWNDAQKSVIIKDLLTKLGDPKDWPEDVLLQSLSFFQKLSTSDLKNISKSAVVKVLKFAKNVKWTEQQATYLLGVADEKIYFSTLTKDSVVDMGSIFNGFLSSDVGKFSKVVLFAAFPELIPVIGIGEPVLRRLIQVFKEQSKNGEIKSFGQFVKYLTREDLSQEQIQDLLGNLEKLVNVDFNEAQIAELMVKLRSKLGNMNLTDSSDDDVLPWGFQNLKKIGKVVLGLTRKELKNFPYRGIDTTMGVLGKQDGWKRRLVIAGYKRVKDFWTHYNITGKNMTEAHIEILGKFVQGLTLDELKSLPKDVQRVAIQKLGQFTGLPEDKLKSRTYFALQYLKKVGDGKLNSSDIKLLGNLFAGLSKQYIRKIDLKALWNNLEEILKTKDIPVENLKEIVVRVKESLNKHDLGKWTVEELTRLGKALKTLDAADLRAISKDAFDDLVDQLGSVDSWNTEQLTALISKAKEAWGSDISKWSEKALQKLGTIVNGLSTSEIESIPKTVFKKIDQFGRGLKINDDLKKSLAKRVKEYVLDNDASNFDINIIKRFKNILSGFSTQELSYIKLDTLDMLDELGEREDWSKEQIKELAKKAKHAISNNARSDGVTSLKNLIKGYSGLDIRSIHKNAFKLAAAKFGAIKDLSKEHKTELANKAKEAWGSDPSKWTAGHVIEAGSFIDGLSKTDLSKIQPQYIEHIPSDVIKNMDKEKFQALTNQQMAELSDEQVSALTETQKSGLPEPKRQALQSVLDDDPKEDDPFPETSSGVWIHATSSMVVVTFFVNVVFCMYL